jgi:hypothetical protein
MARLPTVSSWCIPEPRMGRLRRLAEELEESGLRSGGTEAFREMLIEEIDLALRPPVHERRGRAPARSCKPMSDPATWAPRTQLDITCTSVGKQPPPAGRRFADGLSSSGSCAAPRHQRVDRVRPTSRLGAGPRGPGQRVRGHHRAAASSRVGPGRRNVRRTPLGGASAHCSSTGPMPRPDPRSRSGCRRCRSAAPLIWPPLRHALAQVDGAAIFDAHGVLHQLGVRLVPSKAAERLSRRSGELATPPPAATATTTHLPR